MFEKKWMHLPDLDNQSAFAKNLHCYSEFGDGQYDVPDIVLALLEKEEEKLLALLEDSLEKVTSHEGGSELSSALNEFESFDAVDGNGKIEVNRMVRCLFISFSDLEAKIRKRRLEKNLAALEQAVNERYLSAFFDLSRDAIFSERNENLYNSTFRQSEFLVELMSFAAQKRQRNNSLTYYDYSFLDPFAYSTIENTLKSVQLLNQDVPGDDLLSKMRKRIFSDSIQSAFKRYVCLHGTSYRVNLNRHDSSLSAFPVAALSSTEEIKPLRLFEKTAAYIRNELKRLKGTTSLCEVRVCIIGHSEVSKNGHECSLFDYISAVLNWYTKLSTYQLEGEVKPELKFYVKNLISFTDWPASNEEKARNDFICKLAGNYSECRIEAVNYESSFSFSRERLVKEINENDLIFILDCPWLSAENFEMKQEGSLDAFCRKLQNCERISDIDVDMFKNNAHYFYKTSIFRDIDSQYNRIMGSTTTKSGKIVRAMKDSLFRNLAVIFSRLKTNKEKENNRKRKSLYVFTSEKEGIKYSMLASYPLTRQEKYDGRAHTIARFDNFLPQTLGVADEDKIHFTINLWSILKYISVSYAYLDFKEQIKQCFFAEYKPENPISYFELFRSIVISFNVSNNLHDISIELGFKDEIDACINDFLPKSLCTDKNAWVDAIKEIKKNLFQTVLALVQPLYEESVFKPNMHYGDDAIKTAFIVNLFSSANNVNHILFLHQYRMACQTGNFDAYNVLWSKKCQKDPLAFGAKEFSNNDYFMDKKLYDIILQTLERTTSPTLALVCMAHDFDVLCNSEHSIDRILKNVISVCESAELVETNLYKNALQMLKEVCANG